MLITPYLDGFPVDPESERALGVALEMTRVSLGLPDDFPNGMIAKQVIDLAKAGERNPTRLSEGAIEKLGDAPDFVEVGEAGMAVDYAMRRQCRVQLVG